MIGTHDGHLYEFDPETKFSIRNIVQAHSSTVNTIYTSFEHGVCTGGKDGHVKLFNEDLERADREARQRLIDSFLNMPQRG